MDANPEGRLPPLLPSPSFPFGGQQAHLLYPILQQAPPPSSAEPPSPFGGAAGLDFPGDHAAASPVPLPSIPEDSAGASVLHSQPPHNSGVETCYAFKSSLQEYAQKVGIPTPVFQTVKEGPSHEPVFRSTVIVNDVRYDSLPGFFNRKAAEQSAAEIALIELNKSGQRIECIPVLHETGLCKNLLQEYSQKMNYAIPTYICTKQPSSLNMFTCKVEIGGIQYIGGAAKTKKEAEIKAARTALLAIRSPFYRTNPASQYSVVPEKKKGKEQEQRQETAKDVKPKKASFKKWPKKKLYRKRKRASERNQNVAKVEDHC